MIEIAAVCEGTISGKTVQSYSFPIFIGAGATINNFGFFAQVFIQDPSSTTTELESNSTCQSVVAGVNNVATFSDTFDIELKAAFAMTSMGVQYRF